MSLPPSWRPPKRQRVKGHQTMTNSDTAPVGQVSQEDDPTGALYYEELKKSLAAAGPVPKRRPPWAPKAEPEGAPSK
jgi:hypothetical protein